MISGMNSKCVADTETMHKEVTRNHKIYLHLTESLQITPGLCSMIKVEDVADPLVEAPEKVAEALILFCQVN